MSALTIVMLTSCSKEKVIATYSFNDDNVITKFQKGDKVRYECKKGFIDQSSDDILVVKEYNFNKGFGDYRDQAEYFSAIYNINNTEPVMNFDEYFVVVHLYPNSKLIVASKGTHVFGRTMYTLRTFDGKIFQFPLGSPEKITGYQTELARTISVDDETGLIKIFTYSSEGCSFFLKDITPEEINGNKIHFDWSKH